jgi:IS5 family transposase
MIFTLMKNHSAAAPILPFQPVLRPALPLVLGNVDYQDFERQLRRIDQLLLASGVEKSFVEQSLERYDQQFPAAKIKARQRQQQHSYRALRCNLLRGLLGEDYRGMSRRLAECPLFRWFCGMEELAAVRVPGKSTLQDYAHWLPAETMRPILEQMILAAHPPEGASRLGLANALELETVWVDTTCVKTNIHFPVDWVLLCDAVRTLMKATRLIRAHGLKQRMEPPEHFLKAMNRLSLQMTHARRAKDSKKQRKQTLRLMKRQVKVVAAHARRHRQLLDQEWEKTDWTRPQAQQVLRRIDGVLALLSQAQKQAHERIIGERQVANDGKLLSLYETHTRVIVRGKAGAEVEFGNTLLLAEQNDGMIVDWHLHRDSAPADTRQLPESLQRMEAAYGAGVIGALGADRGFSSAANQALLRAKEIYDGICPKHPSRLKERMAEERFVQLQRRRSQTEGRIGIFKNGFLGRPLRAKGFERREMAVSWQVLTHNLWVLARMEQSLALAQAA